MSEVKIFVKMLKTIGYKNINGTSKICIKFDYILNSYIHEIYKNTLTVTTITILNLLSVKLFENALRHSQYKSQQFLQCLGHYVPSKNKL